MPDKRGLLSNMLALLVDEFGSEKVIRELKRLTHADGDTGPGPRSKQKKVSDKKLASQVGTLFSGEPLERREKLFELAQRYDARTFLRTIGDVRAFLDLRGRSEESVSEKASAGKKVLAVLAGMPDAELDRLLKSDFGGPARLGPLSSAIRASGVRLRGETPHSIATNHPRSPDTPTEAEASPEAPEIKKD